MNTPTGTPAPAPAVVVDGVVRRYGRTTALDGVSLTATGGITGLLGPNGAGKTTLLRILATVQAPDAGTVRLLGHDPGDAAGRLAVRRRLGYLPQEIGFQRGFSAEDFLDYVAILKEIGPRRERRAEVHRVLADVGLAEVSRKKVAKLSGGMRRRLGLAQSLLGSPSLLVLDEPTVGLDPEQRLRFREIVSRAGQGRTVILSTHQTEDVAALCSRLVVIAAGKVRFAGSPADLAATARGRVWHAADRSPGAAAAWQTGAGHFRNLGDAPSGADLVEPTVEDAYLLLVGAEPARAEGRAA